MENLKRSMVIVLSPENTNLMRDCVMHFKTIKIKDKLKENTICLKSALKVSEIPNVDITKIECELEYGEIISTSDEINELRFIIHDMKGSEAVNNKSYDKFSHTVELYVNDDLTFSPNDVTSCDLRTVVYSIGQIDAMLEDVVLDIQMFHFYNFENQFVSIADKRKFSKLKREFCEKNNKKICCDYLLNDDASYCSFASFCRNDNYTLDYKIYCDFWHDFKEYLSYKKGILYEDDTNAIVDKILSEYAHSKQISRRKLYHLIEPLKKGNYILVRLDRKPKKKKTRKCISSLFNGTKIKVGAINVVPMKYKYVYRKYKKMISMFYFDK